MDDGWDDDDGRDLEVDDLCDALGGLAHAAHLLVELADFAADAFCRVRPRAYGLAQAARVFLEAAQRGREGADAGHGFVERGACGEEGGQLGIERGLVRAEGRQRR
jgi:hypothetical protein